MFLNSVQADYPLVCYILQLIKRRPDFSESEDHRREFFQRARFLQKNAKYF